LGQWQFDGSGQQQVVSVDVVRSWETGTASATIVAMIATTSVVNRWTITTEFSHR
jgi:hypothetical protein